MNIDILNGVVTTSEGQSFRKKDIYQIDVDIKAIKEQKTKI